jgi:hypothetical protein
MGLLKKQEVKKLIISPDDVDSREFSRLVSSNNNNNNIDNNLPNDNLTSLQDKIDSNIPILDSNPKEEYVVYSDGIPQKITRLEDLPKFEVKAGTRVKIPSNKLMIKCPFKCQEASNGKKYPNILTFTQNIASATCCGVTYFK